MSWRQLRPREFVKLKQLINFFIIIVEQLCIFGQFVLKFVKREQFIEFKQFLEFFLKQQLLERRSGSDYGQRC